jgi:ribonuclease I
MDVHLFRSWDEHGVCGSSWSRMADEELYFTSAMTLRSSIWLAKGLELSNIVPSTNISYAMSDIDKSITQLAGCKACPHCKPFKDDVYLHEISFCYDKDFSLLDCPEVLRQSEAERCGGLGSSRVIYWPVDAPIPH